MRIKRVIVAPALALLAVACGGGLREALLAAIVAAALLAATGKTEKKLIVRAVA